MQAGSEAVIHIGGRGFERFQAHAGLSVQDGLRIAPGSVSFRVYFDDETTPAFDSGVLTTNNGSAFVDLEVTGVSKVRLVTAGNAVGDWVDAKFLSSEIPAQRVISEFDAFLVQSGGLPRLPSEVQVDVGTGELAMFRVEWPAIDAGMFTLTGGETSDIVTIYGNVAGTTNGVARMRVIINYQEALETPDFAGRLVSYRILDDFNRAVLGTGTHTNLSNMNAANRSNTSIIGSHADISFQRVANRATNGWHGSIWPSSNPVAAGRHVTFVAPPNLKRFVLRQSSIYTSPWTANAMRQEYGDEYLIISTSVDGVTFTPFNAWVQTPDHMGPNRRDHRLYTAIEDVPEGTRYLRVTFPRFMVGDAHATLQPTTPNTTHYRLTEVTFIGGLDTIDVSIDRIGEEIVGAFRVPNLGLESKDVACVLALYDADGRLKEVITETITVEPGTVGIAELRMPFSEGLVRAFVWDADTLVPLVGDFQATFEADPGPEAEGETEDEAEASNGAEVREDELEDELEAE